MRKPTPDEFDVSDEGVVHRPYLEYSFRPIPGDRTRGSVRMGMLIRKCRKISGTIPRGQADGTTVVGSSTQWSLTDDSNRRSPGWILHVRAPAGLESAGVPTQFELITKLRVTAASSILRPNAL